MRIGIIGSRTVQLSRTLPIIDNFFIKNINIRCSRVISGGAIGVDSAAEIFARKNNIFCEVFRPQYHIFGKIAPLKRNYSIVNNSDIILCILHSLPASPGSRYSLFLARKAGLPIYIFVDSLDRFINFNEIY